MRVAMRSIRNEATVSAAPSSRTGRPRPSTAANATTPLLHCLLAAGVGWTDPSEGTCSKHPVTTTVGRVQPKPQHGGYSEFQDFMQEGLTEDEAAAIEALDLEEHGDDFAADVVKEAYAKYLRTADDRFLREARQWAADFGVIEKPADKLEATVDADVDQTTTQELGEDEKEIARELIRQKQQHSAGGDDTDE